MLGKADFCRAFMLRPPRAEAKSKNMPLHISHDVGLAIVKAFEGCLKPVKGRPGHFTAYYCPANVLTIGYGHTNLGGVPPRIAPDTLFTQAQCDQALANDMLNFERHVAKLAPEVTDQNQFDALVSWSFNTGGPASSSVWIYARKGDASETAIRLQRWDKARINGALTQLPGLTRRRAAEAALFQGKVDEALRIAGAHRAQVEPMPQQLQRPKPPAAEVLRQSKREGTAAAAGGTLATGSAQVPGHASGSCAAWLLIGIGIIIVAIAAVLIVRRYKVLNADWA